MANQKKTVSDQVRITLDSAMTKTKLAKLLEISTPTLYTRLETNGWRDDEIKRLKKLKVIGNVDRIANR